MSPKPDQQLNFHGTVDVGVGVCEEGTGVGIHGEGAQVPIAEDMGVQVGVSGGTSREGRVSVGCWDGRRGVHGTWHGRRDVLELG